MDITAILNESTGLFDILGVDDEGTHALPGGIKLQASRLKEANNRIMLAAEQLYGLGFNVKPVKLKVPKGGSS